MVAVDLGLAPESHAKSPNPNQSSTAAYEEDDGSWEVRMFKEDSQGCTWPPRHYTCTFCKRLFGSAQALGGHMNVHRRERARLNRLTRNGSRNIPSSSSSSSSPAIIIPTHQEFFTSGNGLCLLYSFPNPNPIMVPARDAMDPSTQRSLLSISPPPALAGNGSSSVVVATVMDLSSVVVDDDEEIDLELRLGRRSLPPTP